MSNQIEQARHNMTLHSPQDDDVATRMDNVRAAYLGLLDTIEPDVPAGRDLALSLTKLEESLQYAIGAIARNQPPEVVDGPDEPSVNDNLEQALSNGPYVPGNE